MCRYLVFLFNLWLISSEEIPPEANELINHTPLILTKKSKEFHYPKRAGISKDQNQYYFYSKKHDGQYFCPLEPSEKNKNLQLDIEATETPIFKYCLFQKKFKKKETPRCETQPKPLLIEKRDKYGQESCRKGRVYKFVYKICIERTPVAELWRKVLGKFNKEEEVEEVNPEDVFSDIQHPDLYEACFVPWDPKVSETSYRTLFTKHKIRSPYILRNLILTEENSMHNYSTLHSTRAYGFKPLERLRKHLKAYEKQKKIEKEAKENEAQVSGEPAKHVDTYILQQLVPESDFALGHWKKSTYHMINYSPMNTQMVPTWEAINLYIRNKLIELYEKFGDVDIYTGTWNEITQNGQKKYLGNDKIIGVTIPEMWWKLLYVSNNTKNGLDRKGIVVIMNVVDGFVPICKESSTACDPKTWGINPDYYKFVYCCKVETAKKRIRTISYLKLQDLDEIKLMELG